LVDEIGSCKSVDHEIMNENCEDEQKRLYLMLTHDRTACLSVEALTAEIKEES